MLRVPRSTGCRKPFPLNEQSALAPISPYGLEKWIDERYADLYSQLYDFQSLGLRYFNVYGPRQDAASPYAGVISKFAASLQSGAALRILGDGQQTRDFVFVGDVARLNLLALTSGLKGVCNVGTGKSVTLVELIDTLEQVAGRKLERRFEPSVPGDIRASAMSPERLIAWFGEAPSTPLVKGLSLLLAQSAVQ